MTLSGATRKRRASDVSQHVYTFHINDISQRVNVTPSELMHALQQHQEALEDQQEWKSNNESRKLDSIQEEETLVQALVFISSQTIELDGRNVLTAMYPLEQQHPHDDINKIEAHVVIERILSELIASNVIDRIVLCLSPEAVVVQQWLEQMYEPMVPSRVTIDYVVVPDGMESNDAHAIVHCATHLNPTKAFLCISPDKVFHARTIEIMAHQRFQQPNTQLLVMTDPGERSSCMGIYLCAPTFITTLKRLLYTTQYATKSLDRFLADVASYLIASERLSASVCGPMTWEVLSDDQDDDNNHPTGRFIEKHITLTTTISKERRRSSRLESLVPEDSPLHSHLHEYAAFKVPLVRKQSMEKASDASTLLLTKPRTEVELEATVALSDYEDESLQFTPTNETRPALLIEVDSMPTKSEGIYIEELILALPQDQQDGDTTILRRLSKLPSAVQEVTMEAIVSTHHAATKCHDAIALQLTVKKQVPVIGYGILLTALVAVSSQGAAMDLFVNVPPLLKLFWRMTGASIAFAPIAWRSIYHRWKTHKDAARPRQLMMRLAICAMAYTIFNATFLIALNQTSVGHVYMFSNCHSLLMVAGKLVMRERLGWMELTGAAIGFSGGAIATLDHAAAQSDRHMPTPWGDFIAFSGAFAGAIYLRLAKPLRQSLGLFVFLYALVTSVCVLLFPLLMWYREALGGLEILSTHPERGLFGWIHHWQIEAYVVFIGSFIGTMGFIGSMKYFDPLVVSVTMLTEPIVATMIGIALGIDVVPGIATFVGGAAVMGGCYLVLSASRQSTTKIDVSDTVLTQSAVVHDMQHAQQRRHSSSSSSSSSSSLLQQHYGSFP